MLLSQAKLQKVFSPIWPLAIYCFLSITTLHQKVDLLSQIHLELIVLIAFFSFAGIKLNPLNHNLPSLHHPLVVPLMLGLFYALSPLLSSVSTGSELNIFSNDEYKTFLKILVFAPFFYLYMSRIEYRETLLHSILAFYTILGFIFLYRYLILHEVRDFDQRPLLNIRNGDPNFMCTFFIMMLPLALMQAYQSLLLKLRLKLVISLIQAMLFLLCAFLTESRMGLISMAVGMIYLFSKKEFRIIKKSWVLITITIFVLLAATFGGDRILNRFSTLEDKSNEDRYLTYINGVKLVQENPLFGVGMHKAKDSFYQNTFYPSFQSEFHPLEVHNTFLKVFAELGVIGLCAFAFLFIWCLSKCLQSKTPRKYFLISSLIIFTLSSMTIPIAYKDLIILHFYVLGALSV